MISVIIISLLMICYGIFILYNNHEKKETKYDRYKKHSELQMLNCRLEINRILKNYNMYISNDTLYFKGDDTSLEVHL